MPRWLTAWHGDPLVVVGLTVLALAGAAGLRRVGPDQVDRGRRRAMVGAVVVLFLALCSPLATLSEERFSLHMAQHLVLIYVAAPLLALSAPVTLALQAATPRVRHRVLLPLLRSRAIAVLAHPVVTWVLFATTMYAVHFSGLYDASLRSGLVHGFEHLLFLAAASLFWWPVIRRDPVPGSFPWPARLLYLVLAMPFQSMLGVAIYSSGVPLYDGYVRHLGFGAALHDQNIAGAVMWIGGDILMLSAIAFTVAAWMRHEERRTVVLDAQLDAERARLAT